jgi:phage minor structural protein
VAPTNLNCETFLNWILARTNYQTPFVGHSDIGITKSARYVRKNPVEAILGDDDNSMVNLFGGEIKRDNFDIYFNTRIGADNGVKLLFGKNINEINITVDTTGVYTRIMPVGFDGLLLPELYVDSPLINNYLYPKICKYEFDDIKYDPEDEEAYHTLEEAYAALRNATNKLYADGIDKPQINIKIDWIELSKTNEYKQYQNLETVNIGDTIYASILGMELETRVIKTTYNPLTDMIESFEIGTPQPTTASYQNNLERQIEKINPTSILEQARQDATELINSGFGGNVRIYPDRILIMDTDDETTARKVWQWNLNGLGYSSTGINGPYNLAMTSDGQIVADFITTGHLNTSVIEGYDSVVIQVADNTRAIGDRSQKTSTITQDIDRIEMEISDIADITTSSSSDIGYIADSELQNIEQSEPIEINIHPLSNNISYLYPQSTGLYPSDTLYMPNRILKFTNTSTLETFEYELPYDLLYYDANNYDELSVNYESYSTTIIKRCEYNADGTVGLLAQPQTITESFPSTLGLTQGNYSVQLLGYSQAFLFVRLMVVNAYTAQYPTRLEMRSAIQQTADEINLEVSRKVGDDEIISKINQSAEQIQIQADKISLEGKEIDLTSDNITIDSDNFSVDENGNMTCSNADITGGEINLTSTEQLAKFKIISSSDSNSYIEISPGYYRTFSSGTARVIISNLLGIIRLNDSTNSNIHTSLSGSLITLYNQNDTQVIQLNGMNGNITCVSLTQTSQDKYKKNFEKLNNALDIIKNTDIYKYNLDFEEDNDKKHIGLVIGKKYKYSKEITSKDNDGVDIYSMVSVCFKAIKEQQEIIEKLQKRIEVLENEK